LFSRARAAAASVTRGLQIQQFNTTNREAIKLFRATNWRRAWEANFNDSTSIAALPGQAIRG